MLGMSWIAIGVLLLVAFLLGVQLFAMFSARRIKGRRLTGLTGPLGEAVDSGRPVLAYFFSPSCAACVRQTPVVHRLQQEHPDIFTINVRENVETARNVGVLGTPSIVFIREATVQEFLLGFQPETRLRSLLAR
jgi:thioredoxin 1